jgi:hypothetical protein
MPYDSPATIRRRQVAADNKPRRTRRALAITVPTDAEWDCACEFHVNNIHTKSNYPDSAGDHARALVQMAIERRAAEIQRDLHRAYWKAKLIARVELLGREPFTA